jgi:hypothetical protein
MSYSLVDKYQRLGAIKQSVLQIVTVIVISVNLHLENIPNTLQDILNNQYKL